MEQKDEHKKRNVWKLNDLTRIENESKQDKHKFRRG